jgi:Fic family protein
MKDTYTTPAGRYSDTSTAGESVRAFIPNPLPPADLPEFWYQEIDLLAHANRALGRLEGISDPLPDPSLFTSFYVSEEAVLSSEIEGTQSSLSELHRGYQAGECCLRDTAGKAAATARMIVDLTAEDRALMNWASYLSIVPVGSFCSNSSVTAMSGAQRW